MNIGLVYSSLKYVKCNFKVIVGLSVHVDNFLKKHNYDRCKIFARKDQEVFDDLITFEPDITDLVYEMVITMVWYSSLIINLPTKTFIFIILHNLRHDSSCTDKKVLKYLFAACCSNEKEEYVKIMLNRYNHEDLDITYSFERSCYSNSYKIAKLLLSLGSINLEFKQIRQILTHVAGQEYIRISKLLIDIIFDKHLKLETDIEDRY